MFGRTSTSRSMTIKIKTMKTSELDVGDSAAQNYLQEMYGDDDKGGGACDESRTKITT